jgi:hypothetical protein
MVFRAPPADGDTLSNGVLGAQQQLWRVINPPQAASLPPQTPSYKKGRKCF